MARRAQLVCQQLEMISSRLLEDYQGIIRDYIRRRNGVYALYKGKKLYYVGLATSLSGRLKQHLKDRHKGLWDHFSVYLTIGDHHIREMESLLVRISRPVGNKQIGKFAKCENLAAKLKRDVRAQKDSEIDDLFGARKQVKPSRVSADDPPILAKYAQKIRRGRLAPASKGNGFALGCGQTDRSQSVARAASNLIPHLGRRSMS